MKFKKNTIVTAFFITYIGDVETLGPWGLEAHRLVSDICKKLVEGTGDRWAGSFFRQRISSAIQRALSIRCYDCSSVNNSMCLEPTTYDQETLRKFLAGTDCQQGSIFTEKHKEFFCRKIVQTILHKGHDSEVRVTRGCGWVPHKGRRSNCYKADNEDHLETVCQCFDDDCNGGVIVGYSLTMVALPLLLVLRFHCIYINGIMN